MVDYVFLELHDGIKNIYLILKYIKNQDYFLKV